MITLVVPLRTGLKKLRDFNLQKRTVLGDLTYKNELFLETLTYKNDQKQTVLGDLTYKTELFLKGSEPVNQQQICCPVEGSASPPRRLLSPDVVTFGAACSACEVETAWRDALHLPLWMC